MELCVGDAERDLIAAPRVGDLDGAEWLVERYGERAYRLAWRITGVVDDAEAATQSALLTAARAIHSVADEPALESWIYRTVAREAAERRRRRNPGDEMALDAVVEALPRDGRHFEPMQDWSARIDEPALRSGLQTIIEEAIDALPADYRTALVLHDVEGVSRPDIADVLDVDVAAVKARVHRARLFVQQRLSEYFETERTRRDERDTRKLGRKQCRAK
jgi:RNA polymerase sigma-70 factor (ECF subfamily)